jgi:hypothetical protein
VYKRRRGVESTLSSGGEHMRAVKVLGLSMVMAVLVMLWRQQTE